MSRRRTVNRREESGNQSETEHDQGRSSENESDCGDGCVSEDMFAKDSVTDESDDSRGEPDSEPDVHDREDKSPKRRKLVQTEPRETLVAKASSVPARMSRPTPVTPTPISHVSKGRSLSNTPKNHFSSSRPKTLNMDASPAHAGDGGSNLSSVLGEITNMLGSVIERLDKTESKLNSMERQLKTPSSSAASGSDGKRTVPTVVRVGTCTCTGACSLSQCCVVCCLLFLHLVFCN